MTSFLFTGNQDGPQAVCAHMGKTAHLREASEKCTYKLLPLFILCWKYITQIVSCSHSPLAQQKSKVTRRNGSSGDYPSTLSGEWLPLAIHMIQRLNYLNGHNKQINGSCIAIRNKNGEFPDKFNWWFGCNCKCTRLFVLDAWSRKISDLEEHLIWRRPWNISYILSNKLYFLVLKYHSICISAVEIL